MEKTINPNIPVVTLFAKSISLTDTSVSHALLTTSESSGIYPVDADESWNYQEGIKGEALNIAAEGVKSKGAENNAYRARLRCS